MSERDAQHEAEVLARGDWLDGAATEGQGNLRAAISNAMVGLKKEFYGKGPVKAKTFINDRYVFCVMEGGLTRNEVTLVERGHSETVRDYRLFFQQAMRDTVVGSIETLTRRKVAGYHSQITFDPDTTFEIFVLDEPPE